MDIAAIEELWDVVVIGAGPAGSAAAISAAKSGLTVLQLDAKKFPRRKVCGGCLNAASVGLLEKLVGRESSIWCQASPLNQYRLLSRKRQFDFPTPKGLVIERSILDNELVKAGQESGVTFLAPVKGSLVAGTTSNSSARFREIELRCGSLKRVVKAGVVVLATGLGGQRNGDEQFQQTPHPTSRVGIECRIANLDFGLNEGTIWMAVGKDGYVGLAKVSDHETHLAAAVDRNALRQLGPQTIVPQILQEAGVLQARNQFIDDRIQWRGTPPLTARAKRLGAVRVFLVGDAANYVEPFTGEGILWALKSGMGVAAMLPEAVQDCFMGCHGAINGLRTALAITQSDSSARVLLCCVEVCSLHYRFQWDDEGIIGNALFADGSASLVLGQSELSHLPDASTWDLIDSGSIVIPNSREEMSWKVGDHGFEMKLTSEVGDAIENSLRNWLTNWLANHSLTMDDIDYWGVHPGGPRILNAVEKCLDLKEDELSTSRSVLRQYGNMSSPTVLFILNEFMTLPIRTPRDRPSNCLLLAFGPGLIAEIALIQSVT